MSKEIIRRFLVDGEEEEEVPDDDWDIFNDSFNW